MRAPCPMNADSRRPVSSHKTTGPQVIGKFAARAALVCSTILMAISVMSLSPPSQADADLSYPPTAAPNGKRIYLSAAYHTSDRGVRGECAGNTGAVQTERFMSRNLGREIAVDLQSYGYRVKLGRGTPSEAASRSNNFGANAHIPLHSNASSGPCAGANGGIRGTWEIVREGQGTGLANDIKATVGPSSPGTNDRVCGITVCTSFNCLEELCATSANKQSYSETEFHDWNEGVNYLVNDRSFIGFAFALGIDRNFGAPRG